MIEVEGFVIVPPLNEWYNDKDKEAIFKDLLHMSFGRTPVEAWRAAIHPSHYEHDDNFSASVQQWHDRGWRLKNAKITIDIST